MGISWGFKHYKVFVPYPLVYIFFLKIKLRRNKMISAPTAPVRIAPTHPEPKLTPSFLSDQLPTKLPIIPTMILPTSP